MFNTFCLLLLRVGVGDQDGGDEGDGCFQLNFILSGDAAIDLTFVFPGVTATFVFPVLLLLFEETSFGILLFLTEVFFSTLVFLPSTAALLRALAMDFILFKLFAGGVSSSPVSLLCCSEYSAPKRLTTG